MKEPYLLVLRTFDLSVSAEPFHSIKRFETAEELDIHVRTELNFGQQLANRRKYDEHVEVVFAGLVAEEYVYEPVVAVTEWKRVRL